MKRVRPYSGLALVVASALLLLAAPAVRAQDDGLTVEPVSEVIVGVQGSSVDAQDDRRGGFDKYRDVPNGFVLDYLRWAITTEEGDSYFDLEAVDALQNDEQYLLKAGKGEAWRLRFEYDAVPMVYGNKAVTVLGRDSYRIADFIQQAMEDPDGNGVPFYAEPGGPGGDNALVQGMTNDLLTGTTPFDVDAKRRTGNLDLDWRASPNWAFGLQFGRIEKNGLQPLGNGTYQRITDVDGDGQTDYDYFFSIRGVELAAPLDHTTTTTGGSASYRKGKWFGDARVSYSDFDNGAPSVLYDNPFWFTDTEATSGSRRGLWEESRVSQEPSNDAWNLSLTGGAQFAGRTNVSLTISTGEMNQDDPFAAITTNTALIGTKDLNGDGLVNTQDDPTSTSVLPRQALNASAQTDTLVFRLTSRPTDRITIKALAKSYAFDSKESPLLIPARAEYNDSRLKTDMKGADLLHIPYDFDRQRYGLEGIFGLTDSLRLAVSFDRNSWDWTRYTDLEPGSSFTRDIGNRSVAGTDDDTLGLKLLWAGTQKVSGWLRWASSEREIKGQYQNAFDGQIEDLQQFDIADRDRDGFELQLDVFPWDQGTVSLNVRDRQDDYPNSFYGLQSASESGATLSLTWAPSASSTLFLYLDATEYDADMHLRTKCSNCSPPPGATWSPPWGVPNFDWRPTYADDTFAIGGGWEYLSEDGVDKFAIEVNYVDTEIQQGNRNPGPPLDLSGPGVSIANVALAVAFPDQSSTFTDVDVRYTRKVSRRCSVGVAYLYEDWSLDDFMVEQLQPYGANFLSVDDATRYMFLDSWFADYEANVGQLFLVLSFD